MTILERSESLLDGVILDFESWQEFGPDPIGRAQFSKSNIPYPERVKLLCKIAFLKGLNTRPFNPESFNFVSLVAAVLPSGRSPWSY